MAAIIILNVALAVLVVAAILTLLGWGIASDRVVATKLTERRRLAHARRRQPAPRRTAPYRGGAAYPSGS